MFFLEDLILQTSCFFADGSLNKSICKLTTITGQFGVLPQCPSLDILSR